MRPSTEIIEEHTNEDGDLDFEAVMAALSEIPDTARAYVQPIMLVAITQQFAANAVKSLASLVFEALDGLGVLADGYDKAYGEYNMAIDLDLARNVYELCRQALEANTGIVVAKDIPRG